MLEEKNTQEQELSLEITEHSTPEEIFENMKKAMLLADDDFAKLFIKNTKAASPRLRGYMLFLKEAAHAMRKKASEHLKSIPTKKGAGNPNLRPPSRKAKS